MSTRFSALFAVLFFGFTLPGFAAEPAPDFTLPTFPNDVTING